MTVIALFASCEEEEEKSKGTRTHTRAHLALLLPNIFGLARVVVVE